MRTFSLLSLLACLAGCNYYDRKDLQSAPPETLSGLKAFRGSVFPLVREKCIGCHGGKQSPLFAQSDEAAAYRLALNYADFRDPDKSVFVYRSKNGHCGDNCRTDGNEMRLAIETWWEQGQKGDTPELPPALPKTVPQLIAPGVQPKFQTYTWDLDSVGPDFKGAKFSLEIRRAEGESLRYRAPRLIPGAIALRLRAPRVWVNGGFDSAGDVFRRVEAIVNPGENVVLGGETGILNVKGGEAIEVLIEFPDLHAAGANYCLETDFFEKAVRPIFDLKCAKCHTAGGTAKLLPLDGSVETSCANARQRATLTNPEAAPLISYPYFQRNDHPIKAIGQVEADTILAWLSKERDAETRPPEP